ncbi:MULTISPECIES: hypothetical protein [Cyanophyceae]|uniref:hypothetical protein n=1 Tax=Cyanophyceae TaxID=3028117 RepID=UPI0016867243|nr:hypothetical protein [Trichocoleus sp. FACHB-40]MBD2006338.1 hypothetical protein [Trichocoleus sp. FACHB-40]
MESQSAYLGIKIDFYSVKIAGNSQKRFMSRSQSPLCTEVLDYFIALCESEVISTCQIYREESETGIVLVVDCPSKVVTEKLWDERSLLVSAAHLLGLAERIILKMKGCRYGSASFAGNSLDFSEKVEPHTMLSLILPRAQRHAALLEAVGAGAVTTTLHDSSQDSDFTYLDVYAPLPERLNKPKKEMIGQPLSLIDPRISEPRRHYIKRALANGQCEKYSYSYEDSHLWHFEVTLAPLYGTEELIAIIRDTASWQLGHWVNRRTKSE